LSTIINKVAASTLMNFDLESLAVSGARINLDISDWLWQGMIVKEKDFKQHIKEHDWEQYQGGLVYITCSADAIIPNWSYMLIAAELSGRCTFFHLGTEEELNKMVFASKIEALDLSSFADQRVLIKGCSDVAVPSSAYVLLSQKLLPVIKSLMYGEACSNVPIYKKKK